MSGLYHRALEIYRQTIGLRLVGKGEEGPDIEDVSPEDREQILRQIDEVIDRNRLRIQPDTFAINAKRSGIGLPIIVNGAIAAVVIAAILTVTFLFNRQEDVLAAGTGTILSAESKLIETLRRESQAQLQEKDREIVAFQQQLRQTLEQQQLLQAETARTLQQRERQLTEQFERDLADERQRLLDQGLGEAAVAERLKAFETQKRAELEAEFASFRQQTEQDAAAREAALGSLVRDYERSLEAAQSERSRLEQRLEQREAELQQQFDARTQQLESDRARVAEQLTRLQEQQSREQLVRDQILSIYQSVNESLARGAYEAALQQLDSIRSYLDQEPARSLSGIQARRTVELFIVASLEDLIRSRSTRERQDLDSLVEAGSRIAALRDGVRKGNELLEQDEAENARQQYLSALGRIPSALQGYEQLQAIETMRASRTRRAVSSALSRGESLFDEQRYQASLDRYREALNLLLADPAATDRIVAQIEEIGVRLAASAVQVEAAAQPVQPVQPVQPDEQQLQQLERYRSRIAELERENDDLSGRIENLQDREQDLRLENAGLSDRLESLREQQLLLEGDQDQVAARLQRLEAEKVELNERIRRVQSEIERLSAQVGQLETDKQQLTAQITQLETDKRQLSGQVSQLETDKRELSGQVSQLEADKRQLSASRAELEAQRDDLIAERDRLAEENRRLAQSEAERRRLKERLADLQSRFVTQRQNAALRSDTSPETLASLLEAKLLTWRIISSDPVAEQYPELYDTMDRYLETLMQQSLLDGRYSAVRDILDVVNALLSSSATAVPEELWLRYSYSDRDNLLDRLLNRLESVVQ